MSSMEEELHRSPEHLLSRGVNDANLSELRSQLAQFASVHFKQVGDELHLFGHIFGRDRVNGTTPFGNGSDETVAMSVLLRIASQLISACSDLFSDGRNYAAASILRQMVEVEYLAWAFAVGDRDAERWLRSDEKERQEFFRPAKLRAAADGKFRGKDYGYHCEFGGHPTPKASALLSGQHDIAELMMSDLLGHVGNIWNHLVEWAKTHDQECVRKRTYEFATRFNEWHSKDPLVRLPPPP